MNMCGLFYFLGYLFVIRVLTLRKLFKTKNPTTMKNVLKFGFVALAISMSVAACSSNKSGSESADSASSDSAMMSSDSTSMMGDSTMADSAMKDTTKM